MEKITIEGDIEQAFDENSYIHVEQVRFVKPAPEQLNEHKETFAIIKIGPSTKNRDSKEVVVKVIGKGYQNTF